MVQQFRFLKPKASWICEEFLTRTKRMTRTVAVWFRSARDVPWSQCSMNFQTWSSSSSPPFCSETEQQNNRPALHARPREHMLRQPLQALERTLQDTSKNWRGMGNVRRLQSICVHPNWTILLMKKVKMRPCPSMNQTYPSTTIKHCLNR